MTSTPEDHTGRETPPGGSFGDAAGLGPEEGEPVEPPLGEQSDPGVPEPVPGADTSAGAGAPPDPAAPGGSDGADGADGADDELATAQQALADRTLDLQRLQAEYLNYKRRVERDRDLVRENATYAALAPITEVLDTIDRAREHAGEAGLDGGLQTVADQLERTVAGLGLVKFGQAGDPFDPSLHEALSHVGQDAEVEVTTCKIVAKAGYRIGERVVRAAQVLVVDPVG